jgi:hypothetical protein
MRDIYDELPPKRGAFERRLNKERLAQLEAETAKRQARLKKVAKQKERRYNN